MRWDSANQRALDNLAAMSVEKASDPDTPTGKRVMRNAFQCVPELIVRDFTFDAEVSYPIRIYIDILDKRDWIFSFVEYKSGLGSPAKSVSINNIYNSLSVCGCMM